MKSLIVLYLMFSSVAYADKQADKSRTDACFKTLNGMIDETNAANFGGHGDDSAYLANRKFAAQKETCLNEKKNFERQYGKYSAPKGPAPYAGYIDNSRKKLTEEICSFQVDANNYLHSADSREESKLYLAKSMERYKKTFHKDFDEHCETDFERMERYQREMDEQVKAAQAQGGLN